MGVFTMPLKDVVRVTKGDIGLDSYPLFREDYRSSLNEKIQNHFWNQEIGMESVDLWRFNMRRKMAEIMPYYNKLYDSENIKYDPLSTMNLETKSNNTQQQTSSSSGASVSSGTNDAKSRAVNSTFPQSALNDNDTGNYADSSAESNASGANTGTASENRSEQGTGTAAGDSTTTGYTGPAADLLMRYRAALLNIDMLVIRDLQELFMSVWDTGDTYTESGFIA